jgi:hypothetical protein
LLPPGLASGWKNPLTVFFHIAFRSAALLSYIFCTWFSDSFVANFITVVALLA